ncbi:MAG: hypothetical protein ACREV2_08650, partial [Burkholderiales bacterium]
LRVAEYGARIGDWAGARAAAERQSEFMSYPMPARRSDIGFPEFSSYSDSSICNWPDLSFYWRVLCSQRVVV